APDGGIWRGETPVATDGDSRLRAIAMTCALCNESALQKRDGIWQIEGDPMEGALLSFAVKAGLDLHETVTEWPRTDMIPFDASHRLMATLHHNHDQRGMVFVKGAPEKILSLCRAQM